MQGYSYTTTVTKLFAKTTIWFLLCAYNYKHACFSALPLESGCTR